MAKQTIWQWLSTALQRHKAVALLMVVDSKGSSPGTAGAKMGVAFDKSNFGTIGGGKVEHDLIDYAAECLIAENFEPQLLEKKHFESKENASGQICGGRQTVAQVVWRQSDIPLLQSIQNADKNNHPLILEVSPQGIQTSPFNSDNTSLLFDDSNPAGWLYKCIIGLPKRAFIIGGGHVSLSLTKVLALLGFEVTVLDQRTAVKTMDENNLAIQKQIIPYSEIATAISDTIQAYVFVMTHSHETDQQVVESLAAKDFKYFGVLGSRRKINAMKKNLKDKLSEQHWQSIHAPIGLPINSHTPMEIAISIAAELIQFENTTKN